MSVLEAEVPDLQILQPRASDPRLTAYQLPIYFSSLLQVSFLDLTHQILPSSLNYPAQASNVDSVAKASSHHVLHLVVGYPRAFYYIERQISLLDHLRLPKAGHERRRLQASYD